MTRKGQPSEKISLKAGEATGLLYPAQTLFLRTGLATGRNSEGLEYEVSLNAYGNGILIRRAKPTEGRWLLINASEMIEIYLASVVDGEAEVSRE